MNDTTEQGTPGIWDSAWHEGHAKAIADLLGVPYRHAWLLSRDYWRPGGWRARVARWVLRPLVPAVPAGRETRPNSTTRSTSMRNSATFAVTRLRAGAVSDRSLT